MANKRFWSGILILALVLGTVVIGCDNGTNAGTNNGGNSGSVGGSKDITYTVEADGEADKETSIQLTFTFSAAVSELELKNFSIFPGTGRAEKDGRAFGGTLTGSDTSWTLRITNITAGTIRLQITKDGIERGRKTVIVHKDSATGKESGQAIKLSNTIWVEGYLADRNDVRWYKFEAEEGTDYRVQWRDRNGVSAGVTSDRIYVYVTAYESDAETIIDTITPGYSAPPGGWPISGAGTVYFKVETAWYERPGTYAIRFYEQAVMGPLDKIDIYYADANPDLSVRISWSVTSGTGDYSKPPQSIGYRVYRSDTEDGTYVQIYETSDPSMYEYGYSWEYIDPNVEADKTYWYKVAGYDSNGEGDKSEPKESQRLYDVDAGTELIVEGDTEFGEMKTPNQVDWYKFTVEPGKTYTVEGYYEDFPAGTLRAVVDKYIFNSDKTPIEGNPYYKITGLSGTVYIKVTWVQDPRNTLGHYGICVKEREE
jgi:hypothetical protein